jgi:hypothetical protein
MNNHEKTPTNTQTPRYTQHDRLPSARVTKGYASHPIRGFFMASLSLSLAAALTACWSATPQSVPGTVAGADSGFRVTNVQAFNSGVNSQGATGASASSTGISINFDQAVDRASIERAVNVFEGEINHDINPTPNQFTKLGLTSMCNGYWRVRNPNTVPISFTWDVFKTTENGAGVVQANSDTFFTSSLNADTIRVHVNNKQQQVKAKNSAACTSSPMTFAWAADSKSVVASPKTALVLNKTYSVVVSTFAKNSSGSAALSVPYVSKVVVQENSSTSGTLVPGGSFTSRDGVVISDSENQLQSPVNVFVEPLNPTGVAEPFLENWTPINYYRIGANPDVSVRAGSFHFAFPLPQNETESELSKYSVFALIRDEEETASQGKEVMVWESFIEKQDLVNKTIFARDSVIRNTVFVIAKAKNMSTLSLKQAVSTNQVDRFEPSCKEIEKLAIPCKNDLQTRYKGYLSNQFQKLAVEMNTAPRYESSEFQSVLQSGCKVKDRLAYYLERPSKIFICVNLNGSTSESTIPGEILIRHEMFHSIQNALFYLAGVVPSKVAGGFLSGREWIIEGTAEAASSSDSLTMNIQPNRLAYNLGFSILNEKDTAKAYRLQDFWVFTGRKLGEGVGYMRPIFATGLLRNVQDVQSALNSKLQAKGMSRGLTDAYWTWVKNQGYESKVQIRSLPECKPVTEVGIGQTPIRPDYPNPQVTQTFDALEISKSNLIEFDFTVPKTKSLEIQRTMTRVIPIRFTNADMRSVKVTLEATTPTSTPLNYKIYEGTVPTTSTDCTGNSEGTFKYSTDRSDEGRKLTRAEVSKTVSNKTELVIFVANTDFVTPSSFTVKVEAVTTSPNIRQQTPNGLQDVTDQPVYLQGFAGQTVNTTLVLTNKGAVGTSMDYTLQPIGNHVTSGVSVASVRNPVSTPTGTAQGDVWNSNLFQTRKGTLRAPNDPDLTHGSDKLEFPVSATCPEVGGLLKTNLELVYTTGLIDDFGTPDVFSDDKPALDLTVNPVVLVCNVSRLAGFGMTTRVLKNDGSIWDLGGITPQTGKYYRNWVTSYTPCIAESQRYTPRRISSFSDAVSFTGETAVRSDGSVWVSPMLRYQFDNISWTRESRLDNAGELVAIDYNTAIGKDGSVWVFAEDGSGYVKLDEIKNAFESRFPLILTREGVVMSWMLTPQAMAQTASLMRQSSQTPVNSNQVMPRFDSQIQSPRLKYLANLVQKYALSKKTLSSKSYPGNPDLNLKPISGLTNVRSIATGGKFSYAVQDDGTVWTWETLASVPSLQKVFGIDNVVSVVASGRYYDGDSVLAIKEDGSVWGWGVDNYGQVSGDGIAKSGYPFFQLATPAQVPGITGATSVTTTWDGGQSLALTKNGEVYQWGYDGTTCINSVNTLVISPPTVVMNVR